MVRVGSEGAPWGQGERGLARVGDCVGKGRDWGWRWGRGLRERRDRGRRGGARGGGEGTGEGERPGGSRGGTGARGGTSICKIGGREESPLLPFPSSPLFHS